MPIHPRLWLYLAFQMSRDSYQFTRIPFGHSLAPRFFTRLIRVAASHLAQWGMTTLMYLDDLMLYSPSREGTAASGSVGLGVLRDLGFIVNFPKSVTTPTQQLDWLSVTWDTGTASHLLAPQNALRTTKQVRRAFFS